MAIITSLLDNDLYKYTMLNVVYGNLPTIHGEYKFILRSKDVDLNPYKKQIIAEIENFCELTHTKEDLKYLESLGLFSSSFLDFLKNFKPSLDGFSFNPDDQEFGFTYKGSVLQKMLFEIPLMSIISEVYLRDKIDAKIAHDNGYEKLQKNIELLLDMTDSNSHIPAISFSDFGTRRRFSKEWQDKVVSFLKNNTMYTDSINFLGTSNLHLAQKYKVSPIGTLAHEFIQIGQGLDCTSLKNSQRFMLEMWQKEYKGKLGVALTDTIGIKAFLEDFTGDLARSYEACRHDSGDPFSWGDSLINHYFRLGIDPLSKTAVFSDGLDFSRIAELAEYFSTRIKTSFGIGTNLTNSVGVKPLSMVIKLIRVNGNPVAKISDEPEKAICVDSVFLNYLKHIYNIK